MKEAKATKSKTAAAGRQPGQRAVEAEVTRNDILEVASREFADKGLAGARIDEIADKTSSSKRMIYYYFGSKDGLYLAVLEEAYRRMRTVESAQHLGDMPPVQALRHLVEFTYDHHRDNEDFIRLVMSENIHRADYLRQSRTIRQLNANAIDAVRELYERGCAERLFRTGLDPVDIHAAISAVSFFNVSNRHTFGTIFEQRASAGKAQTLGREHAVQMILGLVLA